MRCSALHHGRFRAAKQAVNLLALALIALIVTAPIASSRHELTVQHVRCPEHGELTHVPAAQGLAAAPARGIPSGIPSVEGQATEPPDGHDHCASGCIVRGRLTVSVVRSLVRYTPPPAIVREVRDVVASPGRAFVLSSAPKTSPPSA